MIFLANPISSDLVIVKFPPLSKNVFYSWFAWIRMCMLHLVVNSLNSLLTYKSALPQPTTINHLFFSSGNLRSQAFGPIEFNCLLLFFFLAALGLHCCTWAFSSCERGYAGECMLLCSAWASHGSGFSYCRALAWGTWGLLVAAQGLSCSITCGIFLDQDRTHVSCIGRWILYHWATREALAVFLFIESVNLFLWPYVLNISLRVP